MVWVFPALVPTKGLWALRPARRVPEVLLRDAAASLASEDSPSFSHTKADAAHCPLTGFCTISRGFSSRETVRGGLFLPVCIKNQITTK